MNEARADRGMRDEGLMILLAAPIAFITIVGGGGAWIIVEIVRAFLQ